ncbi:MAG: SUMF1/EgtB/PvdO family nonheme iron enzyme, partial [Planctomycetota bacterium]|nr:SUMF1/EgtB/PvdO family nonheme iron enzyme [Planctomycetota bacterium]
ARYGIVAGRALLACSAGALCVLLGVVVIAAVRARRRPQYSLARLIVMTLVAGVGVMGGMHWWQSARNLRRMRMEFTSMLACLRASDYFERPAHEVTLTRPFYMGKYEVTLSQYEQATGATARRPKGTNYPVTLVWILDAQRFCSRVSERVKETMRLPTEAEWEYACRAGTKTVYYSGNAQGDLGRVAWYGATSEHRSHPVGEKAPNAFGLYDMHGNVAEWCQDRYGDYNGGPATNPPPNTDGPHCRMVRGGTSEDAASECRSTSRAYAGSPRPDVGFRVVVEAATASP